MNNFHLFVRIWISSQNLRSPVSSQMKRKVEEVISQFVVGLKKLMNITARLFLLMGRLSL